MKKQVSYVEKERSIKFVAVGHGGVVIGNFLLDQNRVWSFSYSNSFKCTSFPTLEDFPLVDKTYGHDSCVKFLSERLKTGIEKGFSSISSITEDCINKESSIKIHALN